MKNNNETYLINIYGPPGVGKTTLSEGLSYFLKLDGNYGDIELLPEYAKARVWRGEMDILKNQPVVTKGQIENIECVAGKVSMMICDSPSPQGIVYNKNDNHTSLVKELIESSENRLEKMGVKTINILITHKPETLTLSQKNLSDYQNAGRIHDLEKSIEIGNELEMLLEDRNIPHIKIVSHTAIASVIMKIGETIQPKKPELAPIILPKKSNDGITQVKKSLTI